MLRDAKEHLKIMEEDLVKQPLVGERGLAQWRAQEAVWNRREVDHKGKPVVENPFHVAEMFSKCPVSYRRVSRLIDAGPTVQDIKEVLEAYEDVPEQLSSGLVDAIRRGIQLEETR